MTNVTVTVKELIRLSNTVNGNAVWKINTNEGNFYTKPDSTLGSRLFNRSYQDETVELVLNGAGKVLDIKPA